jgi:hypothetical protein
VDKLSEGKTIFVDEETWKKIVEELGYEPRNLVMHRYIPKNQAIVVDDEKLNTPLFKGYKPNFYFKLYCRSTRMRATNTAHEPKK